jgi:DNA ligase-1
MLLADIVATSAAVAATRSRKEKVALLSERLTAATPEELAVVTAYLGGALLQRRTGIGFRGVRSLPDPADQPSLSVTEVDAELTRFSRLAGPGSQSARRDGLAALLARATADEQSWLRGAITGNLRQGASDALVQEALALACDLPLADVRRASMLAGGTVPIAVAAVTGGAAALAEIGLEVLRPVLPMLASSAPDVAAGVEKAGPGEVSVDVKLDGIRIQVHRLGDEVVIASRSLDDITERLPEVVSLVKSFPSDRFVLDGEALSVAEDGRPRPFQETASRTAQGGAEGWTSTVTPFFFDLLHLDGRDLLDSPGTQRVAALETLVPAEHRVPRLVTSSPEDASAFAAAAIRDGHEGVVIKDLSAPYAAGRRGSAWVKVKPVHTLDLVVLAVEWGSGRRKGRLSNIHLGARDDSSGEGEDGFVMLGKTFKGMTDEMLAWQTERFLSLADGPTDGYVVRLRPEQVVEIAFDGLQRSTRYPGGLALRFARVLRYRHDKTAEEADTLSTVRSLAR